MMTIMSATPSFRDLTVPAAEFKAKCLELMDRVRDQNITVTITKHGRPVACLKPVVVRPKSIWGFGKEYLGEWRGDPHAPVELDWGPDPADNWLYEDDWLVKARTRKRSRSKVRVRKSGRR